MDNKNSKGKFWIFEMYEDSRPEDWKEYLEKTMIKIVISPRHDKDLNKDGSLKKPHFHVLMCFEGPTTYNNALRIASGVGANIVFQAYSAKGSYEYFYHKNNPDKFQYNESDMIKLNGFTLDDVLDLTKQEIEDLKRDIVQVIRSKKIYEYAELYNFLLDNEMFDMTKVLSCNTIFFVSYLRSLRFSLTEHLNNSII